MGSGNKGQQQQTSSGSGTSQSIQTSGSLSKASSDSRSQSVSTQRAGLSADEVLANWSANKGGTDQWSRSAALQDVQGVLRTQASDALQSVMPSIAKTQSNAGAYDSTTKDLLKNDANARINSQLAKTALDAVTQYGQIGNQVTANNNQLLTGLASTASATGTSDASSLSVASSDQNATSFSEGKSQSEYDQTSSGSSKQAGFSLFADGGAVPDFGDDLLQKFMDMSGISGKITVFEDFTKSLSEGKPGEAFSSLMSKEKKKKYDTVMSMFANGGQVPGFEDMMKAPDMPEMELDPLDMGAPQRSSGGKDSGEMMKMVAKMFFGAEDGGKVPEKAAADPEEELLTAIKKYAAGGKVRSGSEDVKKGGKIRGPQSPTGEDNQVIGVAGGEGIIPKDVMDVPGVPEFLEGLIAQYHTPVKG